MILDDERQRGLLLQVINTAYVQGSFEQVREPVSELNKLEQNVKNALIQSEKKDTLWSERWKALEYHFDALVRYVKNPNETNEQELINACNYVEKLKEESRKNENPAIKQNTKKEIIDLIKALKTDDERKEVIQEFCRDCGTFNMPCHCSCDD